MNKKGFTLVELLAVITVLAVIGLIAVPAVQSMMDKSKQQARDAQIKELIKAAKSWSSEHAKLLSKENTVYLPISILLTEGYIENENVKDPMNNSKNLDQCISIKYRSKYNDYEYKYEACTGVTITS